MANVKVRLTGGRILARNVVWNLIGNGAPLIVAIIAIPMLINGLGTVRFGVLSLAWMVVGYFSLFDLGLGRALTKLVADRLGLGRLAEIPSLFWTTMALMGAFSIVGAIVIASASPWLVGHVLKIPEDLQTETLVAFYLLAISIPVVVGTTGLRGFLEAHQRFGLVNAIRLPLGIFTFLGPLAVLPFSNSLISVVGVLVIGRLIALGVHFIFCLHIAPDIRTIVAVKREMVRPLLSFGGWMTVSNIIGPLMVYMDRFLIGAMLSMSAVAYYATPYEVVTKLRIIPGAVVGVLFPAISAAYAVDRPRVERLLYHSITYVLLLIFPFSLIFITFAHEGLAIWLGQEFADNGALVVQWLSVGMYINGFAQVVFALVQGAGRPDITAKLHLIELPFYLLALWWLLDTYGIAGAAAAWAGRVAIDTLLLLSVARWSLLLEMAFMVRILILFGLTLLALIFGGLISVFSTKIAFVLFILLLYIPAVGILIMSKNQKTFESVNIYFSQLRNKLK